MGKQEEVTNYSKEFPDEYAPRVLENNTIWKTETTIHLPNVTEPLRSHLQMTFMKDFNPKHLFFQG